MTNDTTWREWREQIARLAAELRADVAQRCPGPHNPVQHRDSRPAWCDACRHTGDGVRVEP